MNDEIIEAVTEDEEILNAETEYVSVYNWIDGEYHDIPAEEVESYYRNRV